MAQVSKYRYLLNQYPETVQKEQFRIICHISKRTARYLLQSGLVPCVQSGKKTRNYTIKMKDIVRYSIANRIALTIIFIATLILGQGKLVGNMEYTFIAYIIVISLAIALDLFLSEFLLYRYDHDDLVDGSED